MIRVARNLIRHHELLGILAWKVIATRYEQAYLGFLWVLVKPAVLLLIFMLIRGIVGIDSGNVPYPLLTYSALLFWVFFQESAADGTNSIVRHASLIRKVYFPREIFPIAAVVTKSVEFGVGLIMLGLLMAYFGYGPRATMLWVPAIFAFAALTALTVSLAGSALNVHLRDVSQLMPIFLSLLMYASPIIYPLALVEKALVVGQAAGSWSDFLFLVYTANPLVGIIDSFQRVSLLGLPPDPAVVVPGFVVVAVALPISYMIFRRAEAYFADVI